MKGKDLANELEKEEHGIKALILKGQIKDNEQELNHLLNKQLSISKSLSEIKIEINSVRQKKAHLLKKDVDDVELPIVGVNMGYPLLNCKCVTVPSSVHETNYIGYVKRGRLSKHPTTETLYVAGENILAGQLVTYNSSGQLVKANAR